MYYQIERLIDRDWLIVANDTGILYVGLASSDGSKKFINSIRMTQIEDQLDLYFIELEEYFNGGRKQFDWPLIVQGTPFQKEVWEALHLIPYGSTWNYGQIAERLNRPKAVRAVANAIGRNPHLVITPCHRVIGKDGSLRGFSSGLDLKQELLELEERYNVENRVNRTR